MKRARILAGLIGAMGLALAWSGSAFACGSGKILFEDKFSNLDPSWGITLGDGWSVGQGLKMTMKPNDSDLYLSQASLYDNYEVCMTVTSQFAGDDTVDITGLTSDHRIVFHSGDGNNHVIGTLRPCRYFSSISIAWPSGSRTRKAWLNPSCLV